MSANLRLSPAQVELLTDIATHPEYGVRTYSRWGRTAAVLARLGLATTRAGEGNWTTVRITPAGRDEASRRGLVPEADAQ